MHFMLLCSMEVGLLTILCTRNTGDLKVDVITTCKLLKWLHLNRRPWY